MGPTSLNPRLRGYGRREDRKNASSKWCWWELWNTGFWTWQDCCTHEPVASVVLCAQDQTSYNLSKDENTGFQAQFPIEELLSEEACWEGKPLFGWGDNWEAAHVPVDGPIPMHIWTAWIGCSRLFFKKTWSWEELCWGFLKVEL